MLYPPIRRTPKMPANESVTKFSLYIKWIPLGFPTERQFGATPRMITTYSGGKKCASRENVGGLDRSQNLGGNNSKWVLIMPRKFIVISHTLGQQRQRNSNATHQTMDLSFPSTYRGSRTVNNNSRRTGLGFRSGKGTVLERPNPTVIE